MRQAFVTIELRHCDVMVGERRPVKVLLTAVGILAISGATAGLLGIGGALIFNPYLLQLGMDPRVRPLCISLFISMSFFSHALTTWQSCNIALLRVHLLLRTATKIDRNVCT